MMTNKAIAIIDDDESVRESLKWLLASQDYPVRCFADGAAFLADYHPESFNCIILDVRMPGMNGLEVFSKLREAQYFLRLFSCLAMPMSAWRSRH